MATSTVASWVSPGRGAKPPSASAIDSNQNPTRPYPSWAIGHPVFDAIESGLMHRESRDSDAQVRTRWLGSEVVRRLGEHGFEDLADLGELLRTDRERGSELHHGVAAIVGPAVQARVEQRFGEEAAQEPF